MENVNVGINSYVGKNECRTCMMIISFPHSLSGITELTNVRIYVNADGLRLPPVELQAHVKATRGKLFPQIPLLFLQQQSASFIICSALLCHPSLSHSASGTIGRW